MRFRLIRRKDATQYYENVIVSSAITLLGVRLFLQLTGYPQIASGGLHIAHVLWGGLLLLLGSLIALTYRNRPLLFLSSVLTGAGWGLFIDEVGKFISAENDYFFRPAAPIIYTSFLLLWWFALRARRHLPQRESDEIYGILDDLEEVLEASVDPDELAAMQEQLRRLSAKHTDGITDELAHALLTFVQHEEIETQEARHSPLAVWLQKVQQAVDSLFLSPRAANCVFPLLLAASALGRLADAAVHLLPLALPELAPALHRDLDVSPFTSSPNMALFVTVNAARIALAVLLVLSAYRVFRRQESGWDLARRALVLAIVVVDLLAFYFNQFSATFVVVWDVALLSWVNRVQWRRQLGLLPGEGA